MYGKATFQKLIHLTSSISLFLPVFTTEQSIFWMKYVEFQPLEIFVPYLLTNTDKTSPLLSDIINKFVI